MLKWILYKRSSFKFAELRYGFWFVKLRIWASEQRIYFHNSLGKKLLYAAISSVVFNIKYLLYLVERLAFVMGYFNLVLYLFFFASLGFCQMSLCQSMLYDQSSPIWVLLWQIITVLSGMFASYLQNTCWCRYQKQVFLSSVPNQKQP